MAENKTKPTETDPKAFLDTVENAQRREDGYVLLDMMQRITGEKPVMWGPSMIGFGQYHYKYESGREGDMMMSGFSPRKTSLVVYLMTGFETHQKMLAKLGKHKTGKSCLYINKLADVDVAVLEKMIRLDVEKMRKKYGC